MSGLRGNSGARGHLARAIGAIRPPAKGSSSPSSGVSGLGLIPGLTIWYDASVDASITQEEDLVSAWADQSAWHHDASQATGTRQPSFIPSARNGHGILRFADGQKLLIDPSIVSSSSFTVFIVWKNSFVDVGGLKGGFYLRPGLLVNIMGDGSGHWGAYRNTGFSSSGTIISSMAACCLHQVDSATWTFQTGSGGTPVNVTSGGVPFAGVTQSMLGTDEFNQSFLGDIAEVGYATPAVDPALIVPNLAALEAKWGLH